MQVYTIAERQNGTVRAVQVETKRLLFQILQQHLVSVVGSLVLSSLLRSCRKPFMHI